MASNGSPEKQPLADPPTRRVPTWIIATSAVVVFLGLTLGLGLGLGLTRGRAGNVPPGPSAAASGTPLPGTAGTGSARLEDWRLDPGQYGLDMKWDISAPPTTRRYDLVISEGQGWPDGKSQICVALCAPYM